MGWPSYYEDIRARLESDLRNACNEIERLSSAIDQAKVRAIRSACENVISKMDERIAELWDLATDPEMSAAQRCVDLKRQVGHCEDTIRTKRGRIKELEVEKFKTEQELNETKNKVKALEKKLKDKEKDVALAHDFRKNPDEVYDRYPAPRSRK